MIERGIKKARNTRSVRYVPERPASLGQFEILIDLFCHHVFFEAALGLRGINITAVHLILLFTTAPSLHVGYALYPQPQVQSVFATVSDDDQLTKSSQGNKSFVAFSNLNDTEALTKTWKVGSRPLPMFHTHPYSH